MYPRDELRDQMYLLFSPTFRCNTSFNAIQGLLEESRGSRAKQTKRRRRKKLIFVEFKFSQSALLWIWSIAWSESSLTSTLINYLRHGEEEL